MCDETPDLTPDEFIALLTETREKYKDDPKMYALYTEIINTHTPGGEYIVPKRSSKVVPKPVQVEEASTPLTVYNKLRLLLIGCLVIDELKGQLPDGLTKE